MKSKLFIVLILVLFVFALSGCSGNNDPVPPVDPPEDTPGDSPIDAKALIDNNCAQCHGLNTVYKDRDNDKWPDIVAIMAKRASRNFSEEEVDAMTEYLQENYSN